LLGLTGHKIADLATVIFSSGSTGDPKGVMLTHACILHNIAGISRAMGLGRGSIGVSWRSSVGLLNARVNLHLQAWGVDVALFGKNITSEEYYEQAVGVETIGILLGYPAPPATFGMQVTNDQSGAFSHCAAGTQYQSGIYFVVTINDKAGWTLGFAHEKWTLTTGQAFPITLTFDGQTPFNVHGVPLADKLLQVPMPDNSSLIAQFRKAKAMTAYTQGQLFQFKLDQTAQFTQSGTVEILTPSDIAPLAKFDLRELYWIRATLTSAGPAGDANRPSICVRAQSE
jgi:hypothetical protein